MMEALTNGHSAHGITSNGSVVRNAPEKVEIQHRDVAELGVEDILVKVISTRICGSDAHVWESNPVKATPVLGHEPAEENLKSRIEGYEQKCLRASCY
jgi:D-xylulose reductase